MHIRNIFFYLLFCLNLDSVYAAKEDHQKVKEEIDGSPGDEEYYKNCLRDIAEGKHLHTIEGFSSLKHDRLKVTFNWFYKTMRIKENFESIKNEFGKLDRLKAKDLEKYKNPLKIPYRTMRHSALFLQCLGYWTELAKNGAVRFVTAQEKAIDSLPLHQKKLLDRIAAGEDLKDGYEFKSFKERATYHWLKYTISTRENFEGTKAHIGDINSISGNKKDFLNNKRKELNLPSRAIGCSNFVLNGFQYLMLLVDQGKVSFVKKEVKEEIDSSPEEHHSAEQKAEVEYYNNYLRDIAKGESPKRLVGFSLLSNDHIKTTLNWFYKTMRIKENFESIKNEFNSDTLTTKDLKNYNNQPELPSSAKSQPKQFLQCLGYWMELAKNGAVRFVTTQEKATENLSPATKEILKQIAEGKHLDTIEGFSSLKYDHLKVILNWFHNHMRIEKDFESIKNEFGGSGLLTIKGLKSYKNQPKLPSSAMHHPTQFSQCLRYWMELAENGEIHFATTQEIAIHSLPLHQKKLLDQIAAGEESNDSHKIIFGKNRSEITVYNWIKRTISARKNFENAKAHIGDINSISGNKKDFLKNKREELKLPSDAMGYSNFVLNGFQYLMLLVDQGKVSFVKKEESPHMFLAHQENSSVVKKEEKPQQSEDPEKGMKRIEKDAIFEEN